MITKASITTSNPHTRAQVSRAGCYAADLALRFDAQLFPVASDSPARFAHEISGQIVLKVDTEIDVGQFSAVFVDVCSAMDEEVAPRAVFESYSAQLSDVYAAVFDANLDDVKREVNWPEAGSDPIYSPNLLFVQDLSVTPEHTGHGIELLALTGLIRRLHAGLGLTAMAKPDERRTTDCAWLGFKPFYDTEFLVRGTTLLLPTAKTLRALR